MEMWIVPDDPRSAIGLADALTASLGDDRVLLRRDPPPAEVGVREGKEGSDRTVVRVLDAVDRWLDRSGGGSAEVHLGSRSYTMGRRAPVGFWE
jgi:hypothetical protein